MKGDVLRAWQLYQEDGEIMKTPTSWREVRMMMIQLASSMLWTCTVKEVSLSETTIFATRIVNEAIAKYYMIR